MNQERAIRRAARRRGKRKARITIGGVYVAKVSGKLVSVRIDCETPYGGWDATNLATGSAVHIHGPCRPQGRASVPAVSP